MQEQTSTRHNESSADWPACCGAGCAVCVLDLIAEYAARVGPHLTTEPGSASCTQLTRHATLEEAVECCNTGCLICVRDYPELFQTSQPDATTLQLLEALEQAQPELAEAACTSQTYCTDGRSGTEPGAPASLKAGG